MKSTIKRLVAKVIYYLAGKFMAVLIIGIAIPLWHTVMWLNRVREQTFGE